MTSAAASADQDLLLFEVGGLRYALPARDVRELVRAVTIVPLPKAPAIVEGVMNVRGTVVPVLDIRARFRLPPKPLAHTDHLIVAWAGKRAVAIRVDRVLDLARVGTGTVEEAQSIAPSAEYMIGVVKLPDGLALIHDLDTFLAAAEAAVLDAAIAVPPAPGAGP